MNENLDEYSDDDNENKEEEDNSGLRKTEKAAIDPDGYMAFKMPWSSPPMPSPRLPVR